MYSYIQKFSNKVADNLFLSYLISLSVGSGLFLLIVGLSNWNLNTLIEESFVMVLVIVSGITMKVIAGLGISITFGTICVFFFKIFSSTIKGHKKRVSILKIILIIFAGVICGYGIYNLVVAILYQPITIFDQLVRSFEELLRLIQINLGQSTLFLDFFRFLEELASLLFGLWSLIIQVYLIPIIRDQYRPLDEQSLWQKIKGKFGDFKYSLWKGYKTRIRKDYGTVYAAEYERYKTDVEDVRDQLSGILLFPFTFILVLFLPLMGITFILWIRVFSLDDKPYKTIERILLLASLIVILIIATIIFLFVNVNIVIPSFNIAYAMGIFSSITLFSFIIAKS